MSGPTMSSQSGKVSELQIVSDPTLQLIEPRKTPSICRNEKIMRPQNNTYATDGDNIVRFIVPMENIDFTRGQLLATITITKTGGTYARLAQGAFSAISRVRMTLGTVEDECQYFNRTMSMIWNSQITTEVESTIGQDLCGFGTQAERDTKGSSATGTEYAIVLRCGFLYQSVLPLREFLSASGCANPQFCTIELYLENPLTCIETDGTNPQFTVSNVKWNYHQIVSSDGAYEASLRNKIRSGTLKLGYESWSVFQNSVLNSDNDLHIQWKGDSLKTIVTALVDGSTLNDPTVDDKFTTWLKTNGGAAVTQFQHQINNYWFPQEAIITTGTANRAYLQYLNYIGVWSSRAYMKFGASIDLDSFNNDAFLIVADFQNIPVSVWKADNNAQVFNNVSTRFNSDTILRLTLSAAPPANYVAYHFINYNVMLDVLASAVIVKVF